MKSLLNKGGTTDFQVRQWGIRRTWKSVVPLKQQAVTRRVTKAWQERARESMGETPMPLSNTPCHSPLKQQAVTRRVVKLPPKSSSSKIESLSAKDAALTHLLRSKSRRCFGLPLAVHYFLPQRYRDTEKSIVCPIGIVGIPLCLCASV